MLLSKIQRTLFIFLFFLSNSISSYEVLSKKIILKKGLEATVGIHNNNPRIIALEVSTDKFKNEFEVFPDQLIIRPNQKINIRIKYIGNSSKLKKRLKLKIEEKAIEFKGKSNSKFVKKNKLIDIEVEPSKS